MGQLGELADDPDEDKVQGHLCGGWYRAIGSSHLPRAHGWTLAAYRDAFRLSMQLPTCSRHMSQRSRANAFSLIGRGNFGRGAGVAVERRGARVRPWRTLAAQHPELVRELDSARNKTLDPAAIAANSARKLWWRCRDCGHRWQATVGSRATGHGCPQCYDERRRTQGPRAVSPEQSLKARHPALAAEWDRERNRGLDPAAISPKSKHKVWWRCSTCGHEWKAAVSSRTYAGTGCPVCGLRRRAKTQSNVDRARSLAVKHPEIAAQLHPSRNQAIDPAQLGARSSLKLWWRWDTCSHEWRTAVSTLIDGSGCPACYRAKRRERALPDA